MSNFDSANRYTRHPDLISTDMDGDIVAMSVERGEYFGIGGVGVRVWGLLVEPTSVSEIVRIICSEYDVDRATCLVDMQPFIEELIKLDLISAA